MKYRKLCVFVLIGIAVRLDPAFAQEFTPGDAVVDRLSGNSVISTHESGIVWCQYFDPSGRFFISTPLGNAIGRYWPEGNMICEQGEAAPIKLPVNVVCGYRRISGNITHKYGSDGSYGERSRIVPGNQCR